LDLVLPAGPVHYDQCLVTTSPNLLSHLAPALPEHYLKGLLELKSMGAVVMTLSLKRQLSEQVIIGITFPNLQGSPSWPCGAYNFSHPNISA